MGVRLAIATEQLKRNNIGVQRITQLYGECISYVGEELTTCWQSKGAEGEAIINALEKTSSVDMSPARAFAETAMLLGTQPDGTIGFLSDAGTGLKGIASFFQGGFSEVIQDQAFPVIQAILYALQFSASGTGHVDIAYRRSSNFYLGFRHDIDFGYAARLQPSGRHRRNRPH